MPRTPLEPPSVLTMPVTGPTRARRPRTGYLSGSFDRFGGAQLDGLRRARRHCDRLVVGVLTDDVVTRRTGATPSVPLADRLTLVRHLDLVDDALPQADGDDLTAWPALHYDVLVVDEVPLLVPGAVGTTAALDRALAAAALGVQVVRLPVGHLALA